LLYDPADYVSLRGVRLDAERPDAESPQENFDRWFARVLFALSMRRDPETFVALSDHDYEAVREHHLEEVALMAAETRAQIEDVMP
jgi:hypothetical protein